MLATEVIIKPLITEKSTEGNEINRYSFEVNRHADKGQIRRAVEEIYGVRVVSVATQNRKGQLRRSRHGYWRARCMKQAVVKIHPEDRIELF